MIIGYKKITPYFKSCLNSCFIEKRPFPFELKTVDSLENTIARPWQKMSLISAMSVVIFFFWHSFYGRIETSIENQCQRYSVIPF